MMQSLGLWLGRIKDHVSLSFSFSSASSVSASAPSSSPSCGSTAAAEESRSSRHNLNMPKILQHKFGSEKEAMKTNFTPVWRARCHQFLGGVFRLLWAAVAYLLSELLIWGLSRALAPANVRYFASILGMVVVFVVMMAASGLHKQADSVYFRSIRPIVDFINGHLGLGFPIPIIMLDQSQILDGRDIACIIANFVVTNIVSWTSVFALSLAAIVLTLRLMSKRRANTNTSVRSPMRATPPRLELSWVFDPSCDHGCASGDKTTLRGTVTPNPSSDPPQDSSGRTSAEWDGESARKRKSWWSVLTRVCPIALAFLAIFLLGTPILASTGDARILDGCVMWLAWIGSVTVQRTFKTSRFFRNSPPTKNILGTLMNPVLATTLFMIAYTRVKTEALPSRTLTEVLNNFSSGSPLYSLWAAKVTGRPIPGNEEGWFGAGDAALSILECGILIWGFKLYECRRQLFSLAGVIAALLSVAAAAANVFLSVLAGRTMGLETPEALAFAARSATLALAKPAIGAVGGNLAVNAALVVSNGILGQLVYPFALDKLGVEKEGPGEGTTETARAPGALVDRNRYGSLLEVASSADLVSDEGSTVGSRRLGGDLPVTIATGIAIGINGAAMGVAYLYEARSRAAPYAALSMTVYGVMTVVFTSVDPFKGTLIGLASR